MQTDVPPAVRAPSTAAIRGPCPSGTPPLRTAAALQYVLPRGNAGSFPLCPVGSSRFSGRNGRARTSLQFGPKSTRRSRRARTGFPSPSPNIRAAHPSWCWADSPRVPWIAGTPSLHGPMPSEQPVSSGSVMSPFAPESHPHPLLSAPPGAGFAGPESGLVSPGGSKPERPSPPRGTPFGSWGPKVERHTSPAGSRPLHASRRTMGPNFSPGPRPWPGRGLRMLPGRRVGSVKISSGRPIEDITSYGGHPKAGFSRHARYPIP